MPGPTDDPLARALALLAGVPAPGLRKRPQKRQKFVPLTPAAPPMKPYAPVSASGQKPAPEY